MSHRLLRRNLLAADAIGTGSPSASITLDPSPAASSQPPASAAAAKPSIFAKAGDFIAARADLLKKIEAHEATITKLTADLTSAQTTQAAQLTELTELRAGKATLENAVKGLETTAKTAEEKAIDIAAAQGIPAASLPASDANAASASATDEGKYAHYETLKGTERSAYFRANKAAIQAHAKALKSAQASHRK